MTRYAYDALDRLAQITYADSSTITYTYDADGNRLTTVDSSGTTTFGYDALNRGTSESLPTNQSITYGYDSDSNLTSRTDSGGTEHRVYNSLSELTSITDPNQKVITFQYDASGRNTQVAYPNGVTETIGYNSSGQTSSLGAIGPGSAQLTSFAYNYVNPANGSPTSKQYAMTDASNNTTTYQYDSVDRLMAATKKSAAGATLATYMYVYDNVGNMLTKTINGTATSFTYNAASEITQEGSTTFSYDGNGNETGNSTGLTFAYNTSDQTTAITPPGQQPINMTYTDAGQAQRVRAGASTYQYDQSGLSVITDSSGSKYFTHFTNNVPLSMRVGSSTYYYLHDALGSVVGVTDSSGNRINNYAYDPYGNLVSQTEAVPNPLKWLGAVLDAATSLYKLGARYYSPDQGRFTQLDPLHMAANGFGYAADDPINNADPTGDWWYQHYWWGIVLGLSNWDITQLNIFGFEASLIYYWVTHGLNLIANIVAVILWYDMGVINLANGYHHQGVVITWRTWTVWLGGWGQLQCVGCPYSWWWWVML